MVTTVLTHLRSLCRDERGADEGVNKLMIVALASLPVIAILAFFGRDIARLAGQWYTKVSHSGVKQ